MSMAGVAFQNTAERLTVSSVCWTDSANSPGGNISMRIGHKKNE